MSDPTDPASPSQSSADFPENRAADLPLAGQTVLITRAAHQASALADIIKQRGGLVLRQPAIEIVGPECWERVDGLIDSLSDYSRLVFVSSNAVDQFFNRVIERNQMETLKNADLEIAAIGTSTGAAVLSRGLAVSLVPAVANSQSLATALIERPTSSNTAIFRADRGSEVLGERLAEAGIDFEELVIYRSQDVSQVDREIYDKMTAGEIEWTTVTSSAIGSSLVNLFGVTLEHTKIATISPTTTAALQRLGIAVAAEAKRYDLQGIVQAIEAEILKQ